MIKNKNKLRGMAAATPLDESPPNKAEGRLPVPPLNHEISQSGPVDNKLGKLNVAEILADDTVYGGPAAYNRRAVVSESGKLRFIYSQEIETKDIENEAAREAGVIAARRHLNLHHIMRRALTGLGFISSGSGQDV